MGDGDEWASDLDDFAAEEHASKVFALWEIAPELAPGAEVISNVVEAPGTWQADGPAAESVTAPAPPAVAAASDYGDLDDEVGGTDALPALPASRSTRNTLLFAAVGILVLAMGGGAALISGAPTETTGVSQPDVTSTQSGSSPTTTSSASEEPTAAEPRMAGASGSAPSAPSGSVSDVDEAVANEAVAEEAVADETVEMAAENDEAIETLTAEEPPAEPAQTDEVGTESAAVAALSPAAEPVAPEPAPAPRLRIRVSPASAEVTIDGERVETPFDGTFEEGSTHVVEANAAGYRARRQEVRMDEARDLTLRLRRDRSAARRRARRRAARRRQSTPAPTKRSAFVSESPY